MTDVLQRTSRLTVAIVFVLLAVALAVVAVRGADESPFTSADAPATGAPDADDPSSTEPDPVPGPEAAPEPDEPGTDTVDLSDDLVLTSQEVTVTKPHATNPAGSTTGGTTTTTPSTPSTPGTSTPSNPGTPSTPVTPPTTPPVTPPVTPPTPPKPPTPPAPAAPPAVVNVSVLSGGQLVGISLNPGAPNLLNLSLLQP